MEVPQAGKKSEICDISEPLPSMKGASTYIWIQLVDFSRINCRWIHHSWIIWYECRCRRFLLRESMILSLPSGNVVGTSYVQRLASWARPTFMRYKVPMGGSNKRNSYGTIMKHGNKNNIAPANVYLEDILQLYRNMVTFTIRWSTLGHQQYARIGVSYTCSD